MRTLAKAKIQEMGLKQSDIGRKTGMNVTTLCNILNGRLLPNEKQARVIAGALGIAVDEVFPGVTREAK